MKQLFTVVLVMVYSFYHSQTTATSTNQANNLHSTLVAMLYQPNHLITTDNKSLNVVEDAPQGFTCTEHGRFLKAGTNCTQYIYCIARNSEGTSFYSYAYTCPGATKFQTINEKGLGICTISPISCPY